MTKVEEILRAWGIAFNPNSEQLELAANRIQICNECPFKQSIEIANKKLLQRCSRCGCAIKAKMYTPKTYKDEGGSCPEGRWAQVEQDWLDKKNEGNLSE